MESSSGGHGFPLADGEKIVDFVNEIYFGGGGSRRAGRLGPGLAPRLGKKRRRQKGQGRRRPGRRARGQEGQNPGRPGQRRGARRAGGAARLFHFRRRGRLDRHVSFFQKSFPDRFVEVGVAEANMISTGAGLSKAGLYSYC